MWLLKSTSIVVSCLLLKHASAYLPGAAVSFSEGDEVKLRVNKMTSRLDLLPIEYYRLPFCSPEGGPTVFKENLGELLSGDRIENSPYRLRMKEDMYCEQLCITHLGVQTKKGQSPNKMTRAIKKQYHNNWIVDNLNAASKVEDEETVTTRYWQGFPIGFEQDGEFFVNNHVNIEIMYHPVEMLQDKNRIVRFTVEPFSIKHDFESADVDDDDESGEYEKQGHKVAILDNPIASCRDDIKKKAHTNYDMITTTDHEHQPAHGKVLFTYDVTWILNEDLHWASRWDIYVTMDNAISSKVHWVNILNALVIVVVLSAMIAMVLVRALNRDFSRYSKISLSDEEQVDDIEEFGWKLVHADVFRPPSFSPMLLSVCVGSGVQILLMVFFSIIFAALGFLSPARRGSLITAQIVFYVLMGAPNGYTTSRLYKTFKGASWQQATTMTAVLFPGIAFFVFFCLNIMAWIEGSTDAVPFSTLILLIVMWFGVSTPLVFFGAYFGYKQEAVEFPVATSNLPRQIPDQIWYMGPSVTMLIAGILPFGAIFVEMYFIMASIWVEQFYYVFGVLMVVFGILLITCAEITVIFNYFQLCSEDYRWWWRSFLTSGSVSLYIFLYSFIYYKDLHTASFGTTVLYFGYMTVASAAIMLMTGCFGLLCTLWFNKVIFGSIKVD